MGGARPGKARTPATPPTPYGEWVSPGPQGREALCPRREAPTQHHRAEQGRAPHAGVPVPLCSLTMKDKHGSVWAVPPEPPSRPKPVPAKGVAGRREGRPRRPGAQVHRDRRVSARVPATTEAVGRVPGRQGACALGSGRRQTPAPGWEKPEQPHALHCLVLPGPSQTEPPAGARRRAPPTPGPRSGAGPGLGVPGQQQKSRQSSRFRGSRGPGRRAEGHVANADAALQISWGGPALRGSSLCVLRASSQSPDAVTPDGPDKEQEDRQEDGLGEGREAGVRVGAATRQG